LAEVTSVHTFIFTLIDLSEKNRWLFVVLRTVSRSERTLGVGPGLHGCCFQTATGRSYVAEQGRKPIGLGLWRLRRRWS